MSDPVLNATIYSLLSDRAHFFITEKGTKGCAVGGIPIPYRIFVSCLIHEMMGGYTAGMKDHNIDEKLQNEFIDIAQTIAIPDAHKMKWSYDRPGVCEIVVKNLYSRIRQMENPINEIAELLREVEGDYAELVTQTV